jgi:hypothetical protein
MATFSAELQGTGGEPTGRYDYAASRLGTLQCSDEGLNVRTLHRLLFVVPFRLNANEIETESILTDYSIQPAVSGLTGMLDKRLSTAVPHFA